MGTKLYVGNLPYSAGDETLRDHFSQAGTVQSAKVIIDHASGRSKGFGFVEMSSEQEAADAISKLNGTEMEGRQIAVSEARPQQPRGDRGGYGGRGGGGRGSRGGGGRNRF